MPQHHAFGFETTDADRQYTQCIDVRRVAVGADHGVGKSHAVLRVHHGRHLLEVNLVHNAITRRNHVDVFKSLFGPVDEVKTVVVAAVFNRTVFCERVFLEAAVLYRE